MTPKHLEMFKIAHIQRNVNWSYIEVTFSLISFGKSCLLDCEQQTKAVTYIWYNLHSNFFGEQLLEHSYKAVSLVIIWVVTTNTCLCSNPWDHLTWDDFEDLKMYLSRIT